MADRPRDDGWWQASDGKWYPPELLDAPRPQWPTTEQVPVVAKQQAAVVPSPRPVIVAVLVASALALLSAIASWRLASVVRAGSEPAFVGNEPTYVSESGSWALAAVLQALGFLVAAILVIVWLHRTSKAMQARGATGRSWSPGWMIGGWFIPGANLIIPKMAFGELEKIAKVPYGGVPIGDRWKRHTRSQIGDLWWFMWASGSVIGWITTIATNVSLEDNGSFSAFLTTSALATLLAAVSGIPFIMAVRSIERDASQ